MFEQDWDGIGILLQVQESTVGQMMSDAQLETMLTARQVSDFLQVSISTIRRWSSSGMLRCYRVGSRGDRRYRRDDVLRFLQEPTDFPQPDSANGTLPPHRGRGEQPSHTHKGRARRNVPRHVAADRQPGKNVDAIQRRGNTK